MTATLPTLTVTARFSDGRLIEQACPADVDAVERTIGMLVDCLQWQSTETVEWSARPKESHR